MGLEEGTRKGERERDASLQKKGKKQLEGKGQTVSHGLTLCLLSPFSSQKALDTNLKRLKDSQHLGDCFCKANFSYVKKWANMM